MSTKDNKGFTIVELLVALAVFGTVLMVITLAVLQISRVYYKGITETDTQNTMRSIIDTVSQSIQFTGGDITTTSTLVKSPDSFCAGGKLYSFILGTKLGGNVPHVLTENTVPNCASSTPIMSGKELLSPNMRLVKFSVINTSDDLYTINLKIAYGDDDVLNDANGPNAGCKSVRSGSQFCGTAEIRTTVMKRGK